MSRAPSALSFFGIAFGAALVLLRLGELPLLDPDEGRNATIAMEMNESSRFVVPTYNHVPYLDKPALYFVLVGLSLDALGKNELAARLPSALFGLATLALVYGFCRSAYSERLAGLAVVVLATMPLFQAFSRIVIFDIALTFFVCAAVFAAYRAEQTGGRARTRLYFVAAACAGLAILVKGPVGLILPSLTWVAFTLVDGRRPALKRWFSWKNGLVVAALVIPWFVAVTLERPDFPQYGLVHESLNRFTTDTFERGGPIYYYLPVLMGVCFGWSCLFPGGAAIAWSRRSSMTSADKLLLCWAVSVPAFFSMSQSKLPGYVLSAVVALAILTARLVDAAWSRPDGASAKALRRGLWLLGTVTIVGLSWLIVEDCSGGAISAHLGVESAEYDTLRSRFPEFVPSVAATALLTVAAVVSRKRLLTTAAFGLLPVCSLWLSFGAWLGYSRDHSSQMLVEVVETVAPLDSTIACLECFPPGFSFYAERTLVLVSRDGSEMTSNYIPLYLRSVDAWPKRVLPLRRLTSWLSEPRGPVVLIARRDRWPALGRIARSRNRSIVELTDEWRAIVFPPRRKAS